MGLDENRPMGRGVMLKMQSIEEPGGRGWHNTVAQHLQVSAAHRHQAALAKVSGGGFSGETALRAQGRLGSAQECVLTSPGKSPFGPRGG